MRSDSPPLLLLLAARTPPATSLRLGIPPSPGNVAGGRIGDQSQLSSRLALSTPTVPDNGGDAPAPADGTAQCAGWNCTCQGLSDTFGTNGVAWHHAKRDPEAMLFWKAHNCRTAPGGKDGAVTRRPEEKAARKQNAAEDDANIVGHVDRYLVEERDRLYKQQQARLKTEAAEEHVLLAKMLQDQAKGSTVTGKSAGVRQARPPTEDSPAGARSAKTKTAVVIATVETRFCLKPANFDRIRRVSATMLKVRNHGAVCQAPALFWTVSNP